MHQIYHLKLNNILGFFFGKIVELFMKWVHLTSQECTNRQKGTPAVAVEADQYLVRSS